MTKRQLIYQYIFEAAYPFSIFFLFPDINCIHLCINVHYKQHFRFSRNDVDYFKKYVIFA